MPRKVKKAKKALLKKGFHLEEGDHHFFVYYNNGKKTPIHTKISHSSDELSDNLLAIMARQLHLPKNQFLELIDCTMSGDEYRDFLIKNGIIRG